MRSPMGRIGASTGRILPWSGRLDLDNPSAIKGTVQTRVDLDDPQKINVTSFARPIALDNGGGIWVQYDELLVPNLYLGGGASGTPAFSASQMGSYNTDFGFPWIEIFDTNSAHQAVGAALLDEYHFGYFVGSPANWVDFVPLAINDAGQVLGDDVAAFHSVVWPVLKADIYGAHIIQALNGNQVAAPFVSTGSQRQHLQGVQGVGPVRISGFDEAGNVYGSVGAAFDSGGGLIDPGQNLIWVAKPAEWGLSADTPAYTPVIWAMPVLPAGYASLYGVMPGARRVELGVASKTEADGSTSTHGFALVPGQLRVDFNRDGVIDTSDAPGSPDREFVEKNLPYFFWVNDDDDEGETAGDDIPGQPAGRADAGNDHVDGMRDLEDFFPVYLDLKGLLGALPPSGGVTYKLSHKTGVLGYVPTDLTPATAGAYLHDVPTATSLANERVTPISAEGVALPAEFLEKIRTSDKGIILVEASAPTSFPLTLEVWKGAEKIATLELPLSIDSVEEMYRHVNLCGAAGVEPATKSRACTSNWDDRLSSSKVVLFVHGYNVNQQQARGWQAEIFKRFWWTGSRARFWGVTWFGYESQSGAITPDYHSNVVNAFATAPQLASFISALRSDGATEITVAAHSLGNMVVSSAVVDHGAPVTRYVMLDAAVAAEAYDAAEQQPPTADANMPHTDWTRKSNDVYPSQLWASEWYDCFLASDDRHQLTWRDRFSNGGGTDFFNFYSSGEEVLGADDGMTRSIAGVLWKELYHFLFQDEPNGTQAWVYQEKLKGRTSMGKVVGSNFGGWGFNNFNFNKAPGAPGNGPAMVPGDLSPQQAKTPDAVALFTKTVLQETPFFRPGDDGEQVASWVPALDGSSGYVILREPLGLLYGSTGSAFASRHRDTLLARMIPAMSLAAGSEPVEKFTRDAENERNFNMNDIKIGWPAASRAKIDTDSGGTAIFAMSHICYVQALYRKIISVGRSQPMNRYENGHHNLDVGLSGALCSLIAVDPTTLVSSSSVSGAFWW